MAITLKPLDLKDIDHIMTWVNDPEVVKNLQHFDKKFTRDDEKIYVEKILSSKNDFVFSIFNNDHYVGQCGIHQIAWENKLGRLSLVIKQEFWNKGYAQEVLPILIDYSFNKLALHKVYLMHWKENKKAEHIYNKLGFKTEGLLKDEYFWQGQYHDMIRMSIINPEK